MKALGKTDEEITLTRLALLKDLANKARQNISKRHSGIYKKDSEEYKASQDAKQKSGRRLPISAERYSEPPAQPRVRL